MAHPCQGRDQHGLAFPARQAAGQQQHRLSGRDPPGPRQRIDAPGRDQGGIEGGGVHASGNDPDTRGIGAVPLGDQPGNVVADGDHRLAAAPSRHYRRA